MFHHKFQESHLDVTLNYYVSAAGIKMNNNVICIIGPDGVGKTTHVTKIIDEFGKQGYRYEYRWLRFHHFLSIPALLFARIMGYTETDTLPSGKKVSYHHFGDSRVLCFLYPLLLWLDTLIFLTVKFYVPKYIFGRYIICDRFVFDTLVDLSLSINYKEIASTKIGKLFLQLAPQNTVIILLIADKEELRGRREDVYYDRIIGEKIMAYKYLATQLNIPMIDASYRFEEVHKEILKNCVGQL